MESKVNLPQKELLAYYPLTRDLLKEYLEVYLPLVKQQANQMGIDLTEARFTGDHIGIQILWNELEEVHSHLIKFCDLIAEKVIHERRANIYRFKIPITVGGKTFIGTEIFEPKPGAEFKRLKPGVEHCAFKVDHYQSFLSECKSKSVPIDKEVDDSRSRGFKTSFINLIEIEFRNDNL